jgi:uroporphyrin-III C-methyltransferase
MKLSLIGAGPGDAELITLKAVRVLGEADVVLYDALANEEFLRYASEGAEIIYVGKRKGFHSVSQSEINRIIVQNALAGKHVVRLKGGDPVVFGRGFEEMEFAESFGIETALVPGISSSVAVPSIAGIPVTKRGVSESFWVITGHTKDGSLPKDMKLAAQSNATIVILMGISKLNEICEIFMRYGRADLPAGVIENGTRPDQRIITATVNNISEKVTEHGFRNPAIIVFGETVSCCPEYMKAVLAETYQ